MFLPLNCASVEGLFERVGHVVLATPDLTQLDHALQCATRAENAGESPDIIIAALLHDIGHLLLAEQHRAVAASSGESIDEMPIIVPETDIVAGKRAARQLTLAALEGWLPDEAVAAIRLLNAAKRYLCAVEDDYWDSLTPASQAALLAEGGPYDAALVARFRQYPCHAVAVRLRRYDDLAKTPALNARPLSHFMRYLATHEQDACAADAGLHLRSAARPMQRVVATRSGHPTKVAARPIANDTNWRAGAAA